MDSYFHLCECGYHHDCVNVDVLAADTADVNDYQWHRTWDTTIEALHI
jgi:hypothetical protein